MKPDKFNQRPRLSSRESSPSVPGPRPAPEPAQIETVEPDNPQTIRDRFLNKRNVIIGSIIILLMLVGLTLLFINQIGKNNHVSVHKTSDATCPSEPVYSTLTPHGTAIDKLGGWKPVCPPDSTPTYAFVDQVSTTSIVVTEQKLPKDLQDNPDSKIKEIAKNYNASDKLSTENLTAYIGTNADGPQSIIATDGKLLILIQSTSMVHDSDWVDYLDSFKSID